MSENLKSLLRDCNDALSGTPYSIDESESGIQRLTEIEKSLQSILYSLQNVQEISDLDPKIKEILRTREVYESNAIEGAGYATLRETSSILNKIPDRLPTSNFISWAIEQGLKNDSRAFEVIGLDAARSLAGTYASDPSRPIFEYDLRNLHKQIMGDHLSAGMYKDQDTKIVRFDDTEHHPPKTYEINHVMHEFAGWLSAIPTRNYRTGLPILRAAAAHAWLAYIHPFTDGNGRVSRLVANVILARAGLPPLILRNKNDRYRYITALGHSDEAGDIAPLILMFCKALERVTEQLKDPKLAQNLFEMDISARILSDDYTYWSAAMDALSKQVQVQLKLFNLEGTLLSSMEPSDFYLLQRRSKVSKTWHIQISDHGFPTGLWFFGYVGDSLYSKLEKDQIYPSLMFATKNPNPKEVRMYLQPSNDKRKNFRSFMLEPRENKVYAVDSFGRVTKMLISEAAQAIAHTSYSFASDPIITN
jgi:Fic family protein